MTEPRPRDHRRLLRRPGNDIHDIHLDGVDAKVDALDARPTGFAGGVDARFAAVDERFGGVDARFAAVDGRLDGMGVQLAGILQLRRNRYGAAPARS